MKFKEGMLVKISNDLTKSYEHYGSNIIMDEMKGKNFPICELSLPRVRIQNHGSGFAFSFHSDDLKKG